MTTERREYGTLNAMRGVAAIAVVFYHAGKLFGRIAPGGYLAVDLFFVLSGFIIAHAYDGRLAGGLGRRDFIVVRLIRFYPLYIAGAGLGVLRELLLLATHNHYALSPPLLVAALAAAALFVPLPLAAKGGNLFSLNVPSWSLFYELVVNLLYALVFPWLGTAALALTALVSAVALFVMLPADGLHQVGVLDIYFLAGFPRTLFSFAAGILIYRRRWRAPALPPVLLLALTGAALVVPGGNRWTDMLFVLLIAPCLVLLGAQAEPAARLRPVTHFIGLVSFPIYALHSPVLDMATALARKYALDLPLVGVIVVAGLLVCCFFAVRIDAKIRFHLTARLHAAIRRDPAETAAP